MHTKNTPSPRLVRSPAGLAGLMIGLLTHTTLLGATPAGIVTTTVQGTDAGGVQGLILSEGKPLANAAVSIEGTYRSFATDELGRFGITDLQQGSYNLLIEASGYNSVRVVGIEISTGKQVKVQDVALEPARAKLTPVSIRAETVTLLEKYLVVVSKPLPYTTKNVDIPRTINDPQPYYFFDSKSIATSGATDIGEFLKNQLTMDATIISNGQISGSNSYINGNTSQFNLRGLGTQKTLILVNGRERVGTSVGGFTNQTDLNGIPLSAIDHVEVLPSSASAIYGGKAMGGVINVVLKQHYQGGEISAGYSSPLDTDAARRSASASYGFTLEDGRTQVTLSASTADATRLLVNDRLKEYNRNLQAIMTNNPAFFAGPPVLGSLPNIQVSSSDSRNLILKDGTVLSSRITFVPAGTSTGTAASTLAAGLAANAGKWNLELPRTAQSPSGLLQQLGNTPETESFRATVRREFTSWLEAFADVSYFSNKSAGTVTDGSSITIQSTAAANPFQNTVSVAFPDPIVTPVQSRTINREMSFGVKIRLPRTWQGELDYTRSTSSFAGSFSAVDTSAITAGFGPPVVLVNPFVDSMAFALNLPRQTSSGSSRSVLDDYSVRASGPLWSLPWGTPELTVGASDRTTQLPESIQTVSAPARNTFTQNITFANKQEAVSGYLEAVVPLVKRDWLPLVHTLELQLAGRIDDYRVGTGTSGVSVTGTNRSYNGPTLNGQPYRDYDSYRSNNKTVALSYQPLADVTLRASYATAFLPPTPAQLTPNVATSAFNTTILDPKTNTSYVTRTIGGGNPNLTPEESTSKNLGLIWQPSLAVLKGFRFNAEYYEIYQKNAISSLTTQQLVDFATDYPGRVTRDPSSGLVTFVDGSFVNVLASDTHGWDLSTRYDLSTNKGNFSLTATESILTLIKRQYTAGRPSLDYVGFPSENGAAKYKFHGALVWDWRNWTAGWNTTYFGSYQQFGAPGGPSSVQFSNGAARGNTVINQGGNAIPAQTYHDVMVGYSFRATKASRQGGFKAITAMATSNLSIQFGLKNVFNKVPPFDANYSNNLYFSPYGSVQLRTFWLNVKKSF